MTEESFQKRFYSRLIREERALRVARSSPLLKISLHLYKLSLISLLSDVEVKILMESHAVHRIPYLTVTSNDVELSSILFSGMKTVHDRVDILCSRKISFANGASAFISPAECLAIFQLSLCTEVLLASGGDDRLVLDINTEFKTNKYLSSTVPRDDVIRRGSCTCTTINSAEYDFANAIRVRMLIAVLLGKGNYSTIMEDLGNTIRAQLRTLVTDHAHKQFSNSMKSQPFPSKRGRAGSAELLFEEKAPAAGTVIELNESTTTTTLTDNLVAAVSPVNQQLMSVSVSAVNSAMDVVGGALSFSSRVAQVAVNSAARVADTAKDAIVDMASIASDAVKSFTPNFEVPGEKVFEHRLEPVLFPSGTDAELLPLLLALNRSCVLAQKIQFETTAGGESSPQKGRVILPKVFNVVTAAGEVGSGTALACGGMHFAPLTPEGLTQETSVPVFNTINENLVRTVVNGSLSSVTGFDESSDWCSDTGPVIEVIQHKARSSEGAIALHEDQLFADIRSKLNSVHHSIVVLHMVVGSKTGIVYPSQNHVLALVDEFPGRIVVVVDACQYRCSLDLVARYLRYGFVVLVTGSKFFAGPPFCGAALLPPVLAGELESIHYPVLDTQASASSHQPKAITVAGNELICGMQHILAVCGLGSYLTQFDVSSDCPQFKHFLKLLGTMRGSGLDNVLQQSWGAGLSPLPTNAVIPVANVGLLLRWALSLKTMNAYSALRLRHPSRVDAFSTTWVQRVKSLVAAHSQYLELVTNSETSGPTPALDAIEDNDDEIGTEWIVPSAFDALTRVHRDLTNSQNRGAANIKASLRHESVFAGGACTILSIRIKVPVLSSSGTLSSYQLTESMRYLSAEECKIFHRKMLESVDLPANISTTGALLARVMLGQPVKLADNGMAVVRIALGADTVVKGLQPEAVLWFGYTTNEKSWERGHHVAPSIPAPVPLRSLPQITVLDETKDLVVIEGSDAQQDESHQIENSNDELVPEEDLDIIEGITGDEVWSLEMAVTDAVADDDIVVAKMVELARHWHAVLAAEREATNAMPRHDRNAALQRSAILDEKLQLTPTTFASNLLAPTESNEIRIATTAEAVSDAYQTLLKNIDGVLTTVARPEHNPLSSILMFDLDALLGAFQRVTLAFLPQHQFLHCFAVKSCPVSYVLHCAVRCGLGLEAASIIEVKQALKCGCPPHKIMFDSPCKSQAEIEFALMHGVHVNANTLGEVDKARRAIESLEARGVAVSGSVGMRINPLVGVGSIAELSTATTTSKFGVPLFPKSEIPDDPATVTGSRSHIIQKFVENTFLVAVMCHVGSQGMTVEMMAEGARRVAELADEIDAACVVNPEDDSGRTRFAPPRRIKMIDIGGGLSVNYYGDNVTPTYEEYYAALRVVAPNLFKCPDRLICTEFGKSLCAKTAASVAVVEDVLAEAGSPENVTAIVHAGGDLFLRTVYGGEKFSHHRIHILDSQGRLKSPDDSLCRTTTIAGPLCFSGDILASRLTLPSCAPGDRCLLMDAGANTISLYSRHCSRPAPAVFAFRRLNSSQSSTDLVDPNQPVFPPMVVACIKAQESAESILQFWD